MHVLNSTAFTNDLPFFPQTWRREVVSSRARLLEQVMKTWISFLVLSIILSASALYAKDKGTDEQAEAQRWLQRAQEQTNLRSLGAKPFHLRVTFHANAGVEFLPKNKQQIITGDGTYEETWLEPHRWRREVNFGAYHAVETDSGLARKMQASSDYEPVRVLMLLEALLFPVPKNVAWPEPRDPRLIWKMKRGSAPSTDQKSTIDFVQISRSQIAEGCEINFSYLFLPDGMLVQRNDQGLAYWWQDQMNYGDRIVGRHISVQAGGRELLAAEVTVEAVGNPSADLFDLPGDPAEPGMTLRPLHLGEARAPWADGQGVGLGSGPRYLTFDQVFTRQGKTRELELIDTDDPSKATVIMGIYRGFNSYHPAMIDNNPTEMFRSIGIIMPGCGGH
jgi:hypothetical protein